MHREVEFLFEFKIQQLFVFQSGILKVRITFGELKAGITFQFRKVQLIVRILFRDLNLDLDFIFWKSVLHN